MRINSDGAESDGKGFGCKVSQNNMYRSNNIRIGVLAMNAYTGSSDSDRMGLVVRIKSQVKMHKIMS